MSGLRFLPCIQLHAGKENYHTNLFPPHSETQSSHSGKCKCIQVLPPHPCKIQRSDRERTGNNQSRLHTCPRKSPLGMSSCNPRGSTGGLWKRRERLAAAGMWGHNPCKWLHWGKEAGPYIRLRCHHTEHRSNLLHMCSWTDLLDPSSRHYNK